MTARQISVCAARLLEMDVIPQLGSKPAIDIRRVDSHDQIQAIIGRGAPRIAQMVRTELKTVGFIVAVIDAALGKDVVRIIERVYPYRRLGLWC